MLIVKNGVYTLKINARKVSFFDLFRVVNYSDYWGEDCKIPFGFKRIYGNTATIDLTSNMDVLLTNMKSNTRNEIRRAEKEGIVVEKTTDIMLFVEFYNTFAKEKGLSSIDENHIRKYGKYIILTLACHNDDILSMHATMIDKEEKSAGLLYSCSTRLNEKIDKKMVGWANRYLHYKEFELLKEIGIIRYEWCGVCIDPEKPERYSIGQFKLSLGGEMRKDLTLHSPLFIFLLRIKKILNK